MRAFLGFAYRSALAAIAVSAVSFSVAPPAQAAGDLLIAPTRVILDGRRGTEVFLNNIGNEEATYRISLELRRMTEEGRLDDVDPAQATDKEKTALAVIRFAPRRVTLPPNQPQAIRIGMQPGDSMPDGEYRAHLLFRAIPKTAPVETVQTVNNEVKIQLTPIYGISIPVIVRKGNVEGTAAISNLRMGRDGEGPTLEFDMARKGDKSVFGEIHVTKPGVAEPVAVAKGIAIYPEVASRNVSLPVSPEIAAQLKGEVIVSYYEAPEAGGGLISQVRQVLR